MKNFTSALAVLIVAAFAYALFFALPFMYLWNTSLVGAVDGVHEINFLQALGILVMIGLLLYKPEQPKSE